MKHYYPDQKPEFLFDPVEQMVHPAISVDFVQTLVECSAFGDVVIALLYRLSRHYLTASPENKACFTLLDNELAALLQGTPQAPSAIPRLSDAGLIRLFRLIRLSRRLIDLDATLADQPD